MRTWYCVLFGKELSRDCPDVFDWRALARRDFAITNQKLDGFRALRDGPRQLPPLLEDAGRTRVRRAPDHVHAAATQPAAQFYKEAPGFVVAIKPVGGDPSLCTLHAAYDAQHRTHVLRRLRQGAANLGFGLIDVSTGEVVDGAVS